MDYDIETLIAAIPILEHIDKVYTSKVTRDAMMTSQSDIFFMLGITNEDLMKQGWAKLDGLMLNFGNDTVSIVENFMAGRISEIEAIRQFKLMSGSRYTELFRAGAQGVGNPYYDKLGLTKKDFGYINKYRRRELNYFKGLLTDIQDPTHIPRHPYLKRASYYGQTGKAIFFNGMVAGAGTNLEIRWELGDPMTDHCDDCPVLASRVYTWESLPTVPRAGDTQCKQNCYCNLRFRQKAAGKFFDMASRVTVEGLMAPGRYAKVYDSANREMGGAAQAEFEDYYSRMYKARQMMSVTSGQVKRDWIKQRTEWNDRIIQRQEITGYRVMPMISSGSLIDTVVAAAARGQLVDDIFALEAPAEVCFVRSNYSASGIILVENNQMVFYSHTGIRLTLDNELDIVFKALPGAGIATSPRQQKRMYLKIFDKNEDLFKEFLAHYDEAVKAGSAIPVETAFIKFRENWVDTGSGWIAR